MQRSLDRDTAIKILGEAIDRACNACESYLIANRIDTCCWVFLDEIGTVFREYGYPEYGVRIELSKTIGYKTKEVLKTIQETEEQRKLIEKIFMETFFEFPDDKSR